MLVNLKYFDSPNLCINNLYQGNMNKNQFVYKIYSDKLIKYFNINYLDCFLLHKILVVFDFIVL